MSLDRILNNSQKENDSVSDKATEYSEKVVRRTRKPRLLFITEKGLKPSLEYMHITMIICNSDNTEITFSYKEHLKFILNGTNLFPLMEALNDESVNKITIGKTVIQRDDEYIVNDYHMIDLQDNNLDENAVALQKTLQQAEAILKTSS